MTRASASPSATMASACAPCAPKVLRLQRCVKHGIRYSHNMEEITAPQTSPAKTKPKRGRWLLRLFVASLLLILAFVLFCFVTTFEDGKIAWYTRSEFTRAVKPNLITRVKNVVLKWKWTQRFQKPSPQIHFQTRRFTFPMGLDPSTMLGAPASTNFDGMRLWVLSPKDRDQLIQHIKSQPEYKVTNAPEITTLDGGMFETIVPDANSIPDRKS